MKKFYLLLLALVAVIITGTFIFFSFLNRPPKDIRVNEADLIYNTSELIHAVQIDTSVNKASLTDKVIQLTGKVNLIQTDQSQNTHIFFDMDDYEIQVTLQPAEQAMAQQLSEGDTIEVKAKFVGIDDDIFGKQIKLNNGVLLK